MILRSPEGSTTILIFLMYLFFPVFLFLGPFQDYFLLPEKGADMQYVYICRAVYHTPTRKPQTMNQKSDEKISVECKKDFFADFEASRSFGP